MMTSNAATVRPDAPAATTLPGGASRHLRGVVLYDAVDFGGAMTAALDRLTGSERRPVLQIAAPPSAGNAFGSGTNPLACGTPRPENVVALRSIAADWIRSVLTGSARAIAGGTPGERIDVDGATAVVLPAR